MRSSFTLFWGNGAGYLSVLPRKFSFGVGGFGYINCGPAVLTDKTQKNHEFNSESIVLCKKIIVFKIVILIF